MEQIELVIKMPREDYALIMSGRFYLCGARGNGKTITSEVMESICRGTLLPSGHGRLIDADRTITTAWTNFYKHEDEWEKKDNDYLPIGRMYDQNGFECCQQTIVNAPTIIEADKEGTEEQDKKKKATIQAWVERVNRIKTKEGAEE